MSDSTPPLSPPAGPASPDHRPDRRNGNHSLVSANLLWPVILSLLVLLVIGLLTYEPSTAREMARTLNVWLLVGAVALITFRVFIGAVRLRYISDGTLGLAAGTRGQLAWDFASNVTPSAVGGAPLAALYIARDNKMPVGEATALMLFSMLLDQLWFAAAVALIFIASFWVDVYPNALGDIGAGILSVYFLGLLLWICLFAYATLVRPELLQKLANLFLRIKWLKHFRERVTLEMALLKERAGVLRRHPPRFFVVGFLLAALTWICRYLSLLLIVWAVFEAVPKLQFVTRTAAMLLSALMMPTPGGAGGIEGLYALFLAPLMPKGMVAPTLLTWRLLAYYIFIAIGVMLTTHQVRKRLAEKKLAEP